MSRRKPGTPIPALALTYVVVWDDLRIMKVGRAWKMSRLRRLTRTGARVVMLWRDSPAGFEQYALRELAKHFPRAFSNAEESKVALPGQGRGWTECFRVTAENVRDAMRTVFRGVARYERDQKAAERPTSDVQRRSTDGAGTGGAPDRARPPLLRGRRGPRLSQPSPDQGEPLATGPDGHTRAHRSAPGRPRGRRLHPHVRRRRPPLPSTRGVASHRPRRHLTTPTPTTNRPTSAREPFARPSRGPRGSGGRGRAEGRRWERESGERRCGGGTFATTYGYPIAIAHHGTITVLLEAPALRDRAKLWCLRHSTHQAQHLAQGADRRRAARRAGRVAA